MPDYAKIRSQSNPAYFSKTNLGPHLMKKKKKLLTIDYKYTT